MRRPASAGSAAYVLLLAGFAITALSAVPAWLVHTRVVMGEGSRLVVTQWSAWQRDAVPIVTGAVVIGLAVALLALSRGRLPSMPGWVLVSAAAMPLGLLLAAAWPLSAKMSASHVSLSPGLALLAGIGLAAAMIGAAVALAGPTRAVLVAAAMTLVVGATAGVGVRAYALEQRRAAADDVDAVYARDAGGGFSHSLVMRDGRYAADERWSGSYLRSGLTIVFLEDPACPDTRGTYHALPADAERQGDRIRLDVVLDVCAGGERARDLEAGVWVRQE